MDSLSNRPAFQTLGQQIELWQQSGFVGRSFELRLFDQYLSSLSDKRERIFNIYGMGGMGKSRLLVQFMGIAERRGAAHARLDLRDHRDSETLCRELASQLTGSAKLLESAPEEACIRIVNDVAVQRPVVIALDQYEEAGKLDQWFRDRLLPRLSTNVLLVVAGRYPLEGSWKLSAALQRLIVALPLSQLSYDETIELLRSQGIHDEPTIDRVWMMTCGHPLLLSILLPIARKDALPFHPRSSLQLDEAVEYWFREIDSDELRQLAMIASVPRTFNQDLLNAVAETRVQHSLFERLIRLSFVAKTAKGWHIHDLVRESIRNAFRERMPETYERCRTNVLQSYYGKITEGIMTNRDVAWYFSELLPLTGNPVLRAHFRFSKPSLHAWEAATADNLQEAEDYVARRFRQSRYMKVVCSDPESGELFRFELTPEQSLYRLHGIDVRALAEIGSELHLLRNPDGRMVGLAAALPIHGRTIEYALRAPLSVAYFRHLTPKQLDEHRVEPQRSFCTFLYTIDVEDLEQDDYRSAIVRLLFDYILSGKMLVTSPPPLDYYEQAYRSYGFRRLDHCAHANYDGMTPAPAYVLDARDRNLADFVRSMIDAPNDSTAPGRAEFGAKLQFTPREREVAELLAQGRTNPEIASALFVSEASVKKHVQSMLNKTGLRNRTELASLLLQRSDP